MEVFGPYDYADLAEKLLFLEGKPFSLSDGYELYKAIYRYDYSTLILKNGRQTGKTLTDANLISLNSTCVDYHKSLYISPSQAQTTRFSHTKLMPMIKGSPTLRECLRGNIVNNVFLKVLSNGSEITLSYASDDPDRIRGISSDLNMYDEVQDISLSSVVNIADSCLDASLNPRRIFSGTPKSVENEFEGLWERSSKTEPLIKCHACNKWALPGTDNIGKKGFICSKCGRYLNVRDFVWRDFNTDYRYKGFHIPQIVLPAHVENPKKWDILLDKYENWPRAKFNNEVMGLADSLGSRLITRTDLESCCQDYSISRYPDPKIIKDVDLIVAGVDHSGGGEAGVSRTVLHIWGCLPDLRFKTLFYKVYPVGEPANNVDDIAEICDQYGVRLLLGDNGEGMLANNLLRNKLGQHRVGGCRYCTQAKPIVLHEASGAYHLDRTQVIDGYFNFIKKQGVIYPNALDSKVAFDDILNEFSEVTRLGNKIWKNGLANPDDCLHAQILGWLAGKILKRDLTMY